MNTFFISQYIGEKVKKMGGIYDILASHGISYSSSQYIESLAELGIHVANANGVIDSKELQVINLCLGTNLTPTHYLVTKAKSDSEANFTSAAPLSTAVVYMSDVKLGTSIKETNWTILYEFCYAVAMASGGKGSSEDKYAYDYFDKILSTGTVMGISTHPKKMITGTTLQDIENAIRY